MDSGTFTVPEKWNQQLLPHIHTHNTYTHRQTLIDDKKNDESKIETNWLVNFLIDET